MRKIVIDTNIVFSALRGTKSKTRNKLISSSNKFYTPNFLISEIFKHKEKLIKGSSASEEETYEFLVKVLNKINFINEEDISTENFISAYRLCKNVDEKDTPFVALSLELGLALWTRDKELKHGLIRNGFNNFYDESEEEE